MKTDIYWRELIHWVWCLPFSGLIGKCRVSLCITCHRWSGDGFRSLKILLLFGHIPGPSVHCCYYKSEVLLLSVPSCVTGKKWELDQHSDTDLIFLALIIFYFSPTKWPNTLCWSSYFLTTSAKGNCLWTEILPEWLCCICVWMWYFRLHFSLVCVLWTEHALNASSTSILFLEIQFAHSAWALVWNKMW